MINRMGRMKRIWAAGILAAVLLSGCGSAQADLSASSVPPAEEEAAQETEAQQLEKQLIALINLGCKEGSEIASDASLDQVADFCLDYVLQNPQFYWRRKQPADLDGMLNRKDTIAFAYDGTLSAVQAGAAFLEDLESVDFSGDVLMMYHQLKSISVVYGEGENGSVWLMLAFYSNEMNKDEEEASSGAGAEELSEALFQET